jgi:hypothetical protein
MRSDDRPVLSAERLAAYRRMTPAERWREVEALMTLAWRTLQALPESERRRRLDIVRAQHDASNDALLAALQRVS